MPPKDTSGWKIKQIIPGNGWYARYLTDEGTLHDELICWALVEDRAGITFIAGQVMDGDGNIIFPEQILNFMIYTQNPKNIQEP